MIFPAVRHELSFWHGAERLGGDLRLPATPGPHPVVVVVREPGQPDADYAPWLDALAEAGFASFCWARAGDGAREGARSPSVARQAREVLAAVDRLRCLPELDPDAVALLGWGEGGWAAAQAATYRDDVAGLILACTPIAPAEDPGGHDVRPTLSAVTAPVLALFGEHDPLISVRESVPGLRGALRDAGHVEHAVAVVHGADHALRLPAPHGLGGMADGRYRFGDWPAPVTDLLVVWLERQLRPEQLPVYAPPVHAPVVRPPARRHGTGAGMPAPLPVRQVWRRVPR